MIEPNSELLLFVTLSLKFKIWAPIFYIFYFDLFLLPILKKVFCLFEIKLYFQTEKFTKIQNSSFWCSGKVKNPFRDFAAFIVLIFVYLLMYFVGSCFILFIYLVKKTLDFLKINCFYYLDEEGFCMNFRTCFFLVLLFVY